MDTERERERRHWFQAQGVLCGMLDCKLLPLGDLALIPQCAGFTLCGAYECP